MPDILSRFYVKQLSMRLNLQVYTICDINPSGLLIAGIYKWGANDMGYFQETLAVDDAISIG
jgi:DNA topoisomerase VI subunit A